MSRRSARPVWLGEDRRGWDHVRIHVQLIKDRRVEHRHLAVYVGIAVHAEIETGEAGPSKETLGGYAGLSERAVYAALTDLESWDYIAIERRAGKASIYRLLPPPTLARDAGVQDIDPGTTFQGPRQEMPDTLAPRADELEPQISDSPLPPQSGGTPRAKGTNPRALAAAARRAEIPAWRERGCENGGERCNRVTVICDYCSHELRKLEGIAS